MPTRQTTFTSPFMLASVVTALIVARVLCGHTLAAETLIPADDKPFLEVQDNDAKSGVFCAVAVAMDGTVLLFKNRREQGMVTVLRSEDGGKTWGSEIEVGKRIKIDGDMTDDGRYRGAHVGWSELGNTIVDENTGHVMVFPTSLKTAQILYRSKDHGKTWKTEKTVIRPDANGWLCSTMNCETGVTLRYGKKKGRLLMPTRVFVGYLNKGQNRKYYDQHYSNAIYSDDGGKTWTPSAPFPLGGTGEAGLAELSDGRIYYNSRTHNRPGNRRIAYSDDGGETWRDEHEDDELWDGPPDVYGCKAGLVRLPYDDRDILVFSSPGPRETPRRDITVWVSFDGGETWPVHRKVYHKGSYTWMAAGRKGTPSEGMIYVASVWDWFARFNLAWLLEGQDIEKLSKTPDQVEQTDVFVSGEQGYHTYRRERRERTGIIRYYSIPVTQALAVRVRVERCPGNRRPSPIFPAWPPGLNWVGRRRSFSASSSPGRSEKSGRDEIKGGGAVVFQGVAQTAIFPLKIVRLACRLDGLPIIGYRWGAAAIRRRVERCELGGAGGRAGSGWVPRVARVLHWQRATFCFQNGSTGPGRWLAPF